MRGHAQSTAPGASGTDAAQPRSSAKEEASSSGAAEASSAAAAHPKPGNHVIFGGIERLMSSSSGSSSSCRPGSGEERSRRSGPGKRDLAKLLKWKIDPTTIKFSRADASESETSAASPQHSGTGRHRSVAPLPEAMRSGSSAAASSQPSSPGRHRSAGSAVGGSQSPLDAVGLVPPNTAVPSSDSESDMDAHGLTSGDRRRQELAQRQGQQVTLSSEEVLQLPRDSWGEPSSIGSLKHALGECQVCVFYQSSGGCQNGVMCSYCHLVHRTSTSRRKKKLRPCKGKRDRYRKFISRLTQQVEQDPDGFSLSNIELPPSIRENDSSKQKLVARMELLAEQVKVQRAISSSGAHAPHPCRSEEELALAVAAHSAARSAHSDSLPSGGRKDDAYIVSL